MTFSAYSELCSLYTCGYIIGITVANASEQSEKYAKLEIIRDGVNQSEQTGLDCIYQK